MSGFRGCDREFEIQEYQFDSLSNSRALGADALPRVIELHAKCLAV
jgi:hypothetical protein